MEDGVRYRLLVLVTASAMVAGFGAPALAWAQSGGVSVVATFDFVRPVANCVPPNADNGANAQHPWEIGSTLTYRINPGTFPSGLNQQATIDAIQRAASEWDDHTDASLYAYGGTTTKKPGQRDGVNTVGFGGVSFGAVAQATIWASGGIVVEADLTFAKSFSWNVGPIEDPNNPDDDCNGAAGKMDVENVGVHEFGHWAGAAHTGTGSANNAQSMYPYVAYKEIYKQSLASGDIASLQAHYG